ncbi:hypothetical protein RZS08_53070, partial [Arthrospira platensis SPKY1]|nr:hypothetical protein [Arthrospira platensis SPKY1]
MNSEQSTVDVLALYHSGSRNPNQAENLGRSIARAKPRPPATRYPLRGPTARPSSHESLRFPMDQAPIKALCGKPPGKVLVLPAGAGGAVSLHRSLNAQNWVYPLAD